MKIILHALGLSRLKKGGLVFRKMIVQAGDYPQGEWYIPPALFMKSLPDCLYRVSGYGEPLGADCTHVAQRKCCDHRSVTTCKIALDLIADS